MCRRTRAERSPATNGKSYDAPFCFSFGILKWFFVQFSKIQDCRFAALDPVRAGKGSEERRVDEPSWTSGRTEERKVHLETRGGRAQKAP